MERLLVWRIVGAKSTPIEWRVRRIASRLKEEVILVISLAEDWAQPECGGETKLCSDRALG